MRVLLTKLKSVFGTDDQNEEQNIPIEVDEFQVTHENSVVDNAGASGKNVGTESVDEKAGNDVSRFDSSPVQFEVKASSDGSFLISSDIRKDDSTTPPTELVKKQTSYHMLIEFLDTCDQSLSPFQMVGYITIDSRVTIPYDIRTEYQIKNGTSLQVTILREEKSPEVSQKSYVPS